MSMTEEEENLIESTLQEILEKIGLTEMDFQQSVEYHGQDLMKEMQIIIMQQQAANSGDEDVVILSKEKTFAVFKVQ